MLVVLFLVAMGLSAVFSPMREVKADDSHEPEIQTSAYDSQSVYLNADEDYTQYDSHIGIGSEPVTSMLNIEFTKDETVQDSTYTPGQGEEWHNVAKTGFNALIYDYSMAETRPTNYHKLRTTFYYHISDEVNDHPHRGLEGLATRLMVNGLEATDNAGFAFNDDESKMIGGAHAEELQYHVDIAEVATEMAKDTVENVAKEFIPYASVEEHLFELTSYLDKEKYAPDYSSEENDLFIWRDQVNDDPPVLTYNSQSDLDYRYMFFYETYNLYIPEDEDEFSIHISIADKENGGISPWDKSRQFAEYSIDLEVSDCYDCLDGSCDCGHDWDPTECPICGGPFGHCYCGGPMSLECEAFLERSEYEEYLEEGQIAPELLEALREEGIDDLDREAELSQAEEGWLIQQDSVQRYWIELAEKELRVYDI